MGNLLGIVVAAIVNALLGRFFPSHPKVTSEVIAQAQKDRGDVLQSQKDASREADVLRKETVDSLTHGAPPGGDPAAGPDSRIMQHDANERTD